MSEELEYCEFGETGKVVRECSRYSQLFAENAKLRTEHKQLQTTITEQAEELKKFRQRIFELGKECIDVEETMSDSFKRILERDEEIRGHKEHIKLLQECDDSSTVVIGEMAEEIKGLKEALAIDGVWSLCTCAKQLIIATSHLLNVHNCDGDGYEKSTIAMRQMKKYIEKIEALAPKEPKQEPECQHEYMYRPDLESTVCIHCKKVERL